MNEITWTLQTKKLSELKENKANPRTLSQEQAKHLEQSLSKFGQCEPIVIQPNGTILGGHQRAKILKKLKKDVIDVYVPSRELNDIEAKELTIRLNKNTGEFDFDVLANEWEINELLEWGFDESELGISDVIDKEVDESIIDDKDMIIKVLLQINQNEYNKFEQDLNKLLEKYPNIEMNKKI